MKTTKKHGIAVLHCHQEIPCNPCITACKVGAITKETLNSCPILDSQKCMGCKLCVASCPGQAITLQIRDYEEGFSTVTFPFEYRPLPKVNQEVDAVDEDGQYICKGEVIAVDYIEVFNKTILITLKIPHEYVDVVRFMKRLKKEEQ